MAAKKTAPRKNASPAIPKRKVAANASDSDAIGSDEVALSMTLLGGPKRKYQPISVGETLDALPAKPDAPVSDKVIEAIVAAKGKYVAIDTGGRKPTSAAATLTAGAGKRKVKIKTTTIDGQLYAWVVE